jgi:hypothetical protein
MNIVVTDPTYPPPDRYGAFDRLALRAINDPRDLPFVRLIVALTALVVPAALYLAWPGHFRWSLAAAYLAMLLYFLGPFILMLHNTSHNRLFKRRFRVLNGFVPWVLGPFFGESPETYFAHHVGMHHPENNLAGDLSSTMPYRRDSFIDFMRYFGRFFVVGLIELSAHFVKKRRFALLRRTLVGELSFYAVAAALFVYDWRAAIVIAIVPVVFTRFMMMAGNWGQHAFIDPASPENCYRNSITCINSTYNRRCFNDGYHIGHHIKQTRHWTEMPSDFVANRATYAREGAIVFSGIDFFAVWFLLMTKQYRALAKRVVHLDGGDPPSLEATAAMLRSRTRAFAAR